MINPAVLVATTYVKEAEVGCGFLLALIIGDREMPKVSKR